MNQNPYRPPSPAEDDSAKSGSPDSMTATTLVLAILTVPAVLTAFCCVCTATGVLTFPLLQDLSMILGFVIGLVAAFYVARFMMSLISGAKKKS